MLTPAPRSPDSAPLDAGQINEPVQMISWWADYGGRAVLCAIHGRSAPSDPAWTAYLEQCRQMLRWAGSVDRISGLVLTDGGAPTSFQRKALVELGLHRPTCAVVSDSTLVRGVVTAFSWFDYNIKIFPPRSFDRALDHVGIQEHARAALVSDFKTLGRSLGPTSVMRALCF